MNDVDIQAIRVQISEDAMAAYLTLLKPLPGEVYTVELLLDVLRQQGVVYGVRADVLKKMIENKLFEIRVQVAFGKPVVDGQDGVYEYNFRQSPDKKPKIRSDGSVDYWSMNLIETVVEGQVIAIYKPVVPGTDGMTVRGTVLPAKPGKEQAPLKGRGFVRSNDNLTYIATTDGKIERVNNRINISNFHEIFSNVDSLFGNIDFAGDVVVHGNVCSGMSVRAGGTLTVDGVVEGANLWAGKDIVLRGGVLGDGKAEIFARGDIYARFFEYAKVEALGMIQADAFLQCEVEAKRHILLEGKKGAIIGGSVHAIEGVTVNDVGNDTEIKSTIEIGIGETVYQEMNEIRQSLTDLNASIRKLETSIQQFDAKGDVKDLAFKNDPRRMNLLRALIRDSSMEKMQKARMEELNAQEEAAREATLKINGTIHPGTMVVIGNVKNLVKEEQFAVEYIRRGDKIILKGDALVG
jgi:hypothetical protein